MATSPQATPVLDLLERMTADSIANSRLDAQSIMRVRIAALVALDAPPASYVMNLGTANEIGIDEKDVRDVLFVLAPLVGTAKTLSAIGKIARSLGLAELLEGLAESDDGDESPLAG
jgi:hypothetical protein